MIMSNFQDSHVNQITSLLKQTKAGHGHLKPIVFSKFIADEGLCVVTLLKAECPTILNPDATSVGIVI